MRILWRKALSLLIVSILLAPLAIIPYAPQAEAFLIDDELQNREYTHSGLSTDVYFTSTAGGIRLSVLTPAIGYVWGWIVMQGSYLNGKTLNITSSAGGNYASRIFIMDGAYDRSNDAQFLSVGGEDYQGLVDIGNGELQLIRSGGSWGSTTDSVVVNINNTEFYVSLFFNSRSSGLANSGILSVYYICIERPSGGCWWENELEGAITYDDPADDPDRAGVLDTAPGISVCSLDDIDLINPEALDKDGIEYVFVNEKYYLFNATWQGANMTQSDYYAVQFSDGYQNFTVSYNYTSDRFSIESGEDYIRTMDSSPEWMDYDNDTQVLWVVFPIYLKEDVEDAEDVSMSGYCSADNGWESSSLVFHIYSQGEDVEISLQFNATRPEYGEWFEMCAWETGIASANKTLRKFEHFSTEFAVRFYRNDSGTWVPEDQFMQDPNHLGALPDTVYGGPGDWRIRFNIWAFDNATDAWIILWGISFWMFEGNEGASDEWIAVRTQARNRTAWLTNYYETFTAFIEEEPAARFRLWMDLWVSPTNSSSVGASRINPYYYGMQDVGWFMWGSWSPFLANVTEAMYFTPLTNGNDVITPASQFDLMKIEAELDFGVSGGSELYMVCIEDVNINEIKTASRGSSIQGVDTPIYNAPKIPDMPITGMLAPLYSALTSLAGNIWDALAGILELAWDAISTQFPWFTQFIDDMYSLIASFSQFLQSIASGLASLLDFMAESLWLFPVLTGAISDTWVMLVSWLDPFVANAGDWVLLAVIAFGIIPFAANLSEGKIQAVRNDIDAVWGFLSTMLDWIFRLGKMAIDLVLGLIPG